MGARKRQSETGKEKTKIIIVDDHPIIRKGLSDLINQEKDLAVCGQAEDAHEGLQAIKTLNPDMVVVDISLKETSGIELIKDIKTQYPNLSVLALSMHDESLYAERALRAGAKGYIMKAEATEKVITAIHKVLSGELYVSDRMAAKLVRKLVGSGPEIGASPIDRLSDRELEVFLLLGRGQGTREIAEKLHLSIKTIETYRAHIKDKLDLAGAAELLQYAIQWVSGQNKG
jgi:DNA-binding NarL/FixJ family response regulator